MAVAVSAATAPGPRDPAAPVLVLRRREVPWPEEYDAVVAEEIVGVVSCRGGAVRAWCPDRASLLVHSAAPLPPREPSRSLEEAAGDPDLAEAAGAILAWLGAGRPGAPWRPTRPRAPYRVEAPPGATVGGVARAVEAPPLSAPPASKPTCPPPSPRGTGEVAGA